MKKSMQALLLLLVVATFYGCPNNDYFENEKFLFENNSEKTIAFYLADVTSRTIYPDTILPEFDYGVTELNSGMGTLMKVWKTEKDYLYFFVFDSDTLKKYPWEVIRKDYKILKRYLVDMNKVRQGGYKITYP